MDCSTPGFPVLHHLPELAQTHVHQVSDAIQPSYPLSFFSFCLQSFPESGSFPMSWLFASGGQRIGASASASASSPFNEHSGLISFKMTGWISLLSKGLWGVFSRTTNRSINFSVLSLLYGPTLTFVHNDWKKTIALTRQIFGIVNKAEIDVFLELSCFFDDPADAGNLISGSSAFPKTSLNIWKFTVHVLLKPGLENVEHYFTSV